MTSAHVLDDSDIQRDHETEWNGSEDDEAPVEVSQADAKTAEIELSNSLPAEVFQRTARARKVLREKQRRGKLQLNSGSKRSPKIIGGVDANVSQIPTLPQREDNVQLVVTKIINGKQVMVYQDRTVDENDSGDEDSSDDEEETLDMDCSVSKFVDDFFHGKRLRRVDAISLKRGNNKIQKRRNRSHVHKRIRA